MLDHLGLPRAAAQLESAVGAALAAQVTTPDLGGSGSTVDVGQWLADRIGAT